MSSLGDKNVHPAHTDAIFQPGMTLREHYAGLAMQAIIPEMAAWDYERCAFHAVKFADALLAELEKSK